ncbi:MAG: hypothetical protein MJ151_04450 [Lachnospiraceae bacterium]|nr:hypothetical protein [Lachnospiraceae bacterium]
MKACKKHNIFKKIISVVLTISFVLDMCGEALASSNSLSRLLGIDNDDLSSYIEEVEKK